jgi:hypothetical protein
LSAVTRRKFLHVTASLASAWMSASSPCPVCLSELSRACCGRQLRRCGCRLLPGGVTSSLGAVGGGQCSVSSWPGETPSCAEGRPALGRSTEIVHGGEGIGRVAGVRLLVKGRCGLDGPWFVRLCGAALPLVGDFASLWRSGSVVVVRLRSMREVHGLGDGMLAAGCRHPGRSA